MKGNKQQAAATTELADRLPPHSIEAEQGVLGCVLLSPGDVLVECAERWGASTEVFYDIRHIKLMEMIQRLARDGSGLDLVILQQRLRDAGELEACGGLTYLTGLMDAVPSAANFGYYADIVWEKYQLRELQRRVVQIQHAIMTHQGEVNALLNEAEENIYNVPRDRSYGAQPLSACLPDTVDRLEHYARGFGTITGVPTGFRYWDRFSSGLQRQELIIIGGRPGTGKTTLAMNVAERVALNAGSPVGVLSMEMGRTDLTLRLLCARTEVNFHKLRTGGMVEEDQRRMLAVMPRMNKAPIYVDDAAGLTIFDIRARLRAMKQKYGIKLAIVDYLQLASLPAHWKNDKAGGYGEVAKGLMASAKELDIPIILLSQLSRESEKRGGRPKMSDLRESGDIEACGHFIGILYREAMEPEEEAELRKTVADNPLAEVTLPVAMEVCKNRNGPSGTDIRFEFKRWCMKFEDEQYRSKLDPEVVQAIEAYKLEQARKVSGEDVP